jgi:hypothetical protein
MLEHLLNRGGALNFANTKELLANETESGTSMITHKLTSTEWRKQLKVSHEMESLPT